MTKKQPELFEPVAGHKPPEAATKTETPPDPTAPEVNTEPRALVSLTYARTKAAIENAQARALERIEAEKALKAAALTFTTAEDWVLHRAESGDERVPYLERTGSEKLIHAFGIELEITDHDREDYPEDGTFEIVITGRARALVMSDLWYPEVGSRWSGDGFFSKGGKIRVDPGDVRKSAVTSFYNRAIKCVLGLRGLTEADLARVPTVDIDKVRFVTYQESSANGAGGGSLADILAVKHIAIFIPYEDVTNRDRWKRGARGTRFHREPHPVIEAPKLWIVPHTSELESLAADLAADNADIKFRVVDVNGD